MGSCGKVTIVTYRGKKEERQKITILLYPNGWIPPAAGRMSVSSMGNPSGKENPCCRHLEWSLH